MAENNIEKMSSSVKSFMRAGPTLHYSHHNVYRCWGLAIVVYIAAVLFWSRIVTGSAFMLDLISMFDIEQWNLGRQVLSPLSIFEYPMQIVVLALIMGVLSILPLLVSQLFSFKFSIPMILSAIFIARLPVLGGALLIACMAVACRPLRFRSRYISLALCMAPMLIYWGVLGRTEDTDPIRWGAAYLPWSSAWLAGLIIAAIVLGAGHFTRYRPGFIWSVCFVVIAIAFGIFQYNISFDELDYQLYIARNNPEEVTEFHDHSLTKYIDKAVGDPKIERYLTGPFGATEPIAFRKEVKEYIQSQLRYDRWPHWFRIPSEVNYQAKRQLLMAQYDRFISKWPDSRRVAIALYYKALLSEYTPDLRKFELTEELHLHWDYPYRENLPIWYELYDRPDQSPEALEARWRIAMHLAGQGDFYKARELADVAMVLVNKRLEETHQKSDHEESIFKIFTSPAKTVMNRYKLAELRIKLNKLRDVISKHNYTDDQQSNRRLAEFVILNPYKKDYPDKLDEMLAEVPEDDPLRDNVLLARIMQISDSQMRADQLESLVKKYPDSDGGREALYKLGLLKVVLWKESQAQDKKRDEMLIQARSTLGMYVELYPESFQTAQAKELLDSLPVIK